MKILRQFKDFIIHEFTIPNCVKHPEANYSRYIGCSQCYREALRLDREQARKEKISIIKQAIIEAQLELKGDK